jgi:thioredoxin
MNLLINEDNNFMKWKGVITFVIMFVFVISCKGQTTEESSNSIIKVTSKAKVTFVELGSVNCIPCKKMQPVMKAIAEKYAEQIEILFYDVWKSEQKKYAAEYGIKLIPTQVFLDENGKEFHRHEGFYPETEIDKILQSKGLKPKEKND